MQIERGASNTFALLGRPILSPSYWLLWFRDPERNASVYCIADASNTTGGMLTLTFTETDTPTALDGEVKLSPRGNWELKVYEQTSATNLDPASAGRLVKTIGVLVVGDAAADTGWSGTACPPGGDCDPTTVNGTESDTPTILVQQGGVEVGTLAPSTGIHTVPECPDCDPLGYDLHNTRDTILISGVVLDPCGATLELTAPDAELTFDGQPLLSIPSDDTANITCSTLLDAAYVEDGASITGSYVITGTLNGRSIYTLDADHSLRYSGTRWELVKPGVDYQAAVGTQTYPWQADWSATPATVTQGTVGTVCQGPLIPCDPLTYEVYNTEATLLIDGSQVDPCGVLVQLTVQDGSAVLKDTAGTTLSTTPIPATTTKNITAPDATVLRDGIAYSTVRSGGSIDVPSDCESLCELITSSPVSEGADCIRSSGQQDEYLANLIPAVDLADTITQVFTPQTLEQRFAIKEHIHGLSYQGEFPVLTEKTPTYNDEGDTTTGWTLTNGALSQPSASVVRLTQSTTAASTADRAITMPKTNADWCLYLRARGRRTTGDAQSFQIVSSGTGRAILYFNFNSVTSTSVLGTVSIRHISDAGVTSNVVFSTGVLVDTNWQDVVLTYNHTRSNLSLWIRQTDGTWRFGCQTNGSFFGATLRIAAANSTTAGSWAEFDWITLVLPNIQSIGDSLTQGATLFSPVIASALNNGDSCFQRWLTLYPSLRNNYVPNKGVGGNTTAMVLARISADVLNNEPALVLLAACNNDLNVPIAQATRTANIQASIDLCTAASAPVVLFNATYATADRVPQPDYRDYYEESWELYLPALTGLQGRVDIMESLRGPDGYANELFTDADFTHPNVTGYTLMGQAISSLPYA